MRSILRVLLISIYFLCANTIATAVDLKKKPKLILVLVYDQFRADMLSRFEKQFQKKGFRFLMESGAYFPYAEYEVLQCMTCPGHAMILSGSYPYNNGIPINEWIDSSTGDEVYCAQDSEHGLSPRRLKASTVGDELKMVSKNSRVVGIALKDRSAIMLAGHDANLALWFNSKKMQWETSPYYKNTGDLAWLQKWNAKTSQLENTEIAWKPVFSKAKFQYKAKSSSNVALGFPFGTQLTQQVAIEALKKMQLGQQAQTDLLAVSFSSHDLNGHAYGPNSEEIEEMTLSEDYELAQFLKEINQQVGLKNTWIVLTADHGVGPTEEFARSKGFDAGRIDSDSILKLLSQELDRKFSKPKSKKWFAGTSSLHLYFTSEVIQQFQTQLPEIEAFSKKFLLQQNGVAEVVTSSEYRAGKYPPEMHGRQTTKSYVPGISGDLLMIPKPFWTNKGSNKATHITGYAYDRTVPLIFVGAPFKAGVYAQPAKVVDIAPTLTFLLGTVPPSLSEGRVLSEVLK